MAELSREQQHILLERQKQRWALRQEYIKQSTNPHRFGHGGHLFDEGLARFQAMNANHYEHFKPTWTSFRKGILFCIVPIFLFGWAMKLERDGRESKIRKGEIAYKDRRFKFI